MSSTRFNPPVPTFEEVGPLGVGLPEDDGFIVPGENDYAGTTNKRTLRSYLSSLTRGEVPTVNVVEYNGPVPDHGNAYPVGDGSGNPDRSFTELGIEGGSVNELDNYSNSGLFDGAVSDKNLSSIIDKGDLGSAHGQNSLSGHLLLPGVESIRPSTGGEAYEEIISEVLRDKNPNNPDAPAISEFELPLDPFDREILRGPSSRVKISTGESVSFPSSAPTPTSEKVSIVELSKVAADIMLRSTGKSNGPDQYGEFTAGFIPSTVQTGIGRVDTDDLRARNYAGLSGLNSTVDGVDVSFPRSDGVGETRYSDKSYGNTYNYLENFTDLNSGVTAFAALGAGAFAAVFALLAIFAIPGVGGPTERIPRYPDLSTSTKRYSKLEAGSFRIKDESNPISDLLSSVGIETDILQLLNFYRPTNKYTDYGNCVILGFASFIGANSSITADNILAEGLFGAEKSFSRLAIGRLSLAIAARFLVIPLTSEKGYYLNIFREIMKEAGSIVSSISDIGIANLVSTLTSAKIVRFIDTLAKIGDLILLQIAAKEEYKFNDIVEDPYIRGFNVAEKGDPAAARLFASQRIRGSQFGSTNGNKRGTHLAVNEIPSAHLIPESYKSLISNEKIKSFVATGSLNRTNLRLKKSDVVQIESLLDAEYMPFYFQDLRTNEIVAFHAFLDELSDSYSAEYNSTSGYGRVEDIKMYKSTKRSVGCTFHVISTNPDDFEYMWWQINKLTTMVYPQWSQGRSISTKLNENDFKFTQPFSQIPTATPVIRVRVGDLVRSNYSRFNLKRLFGFQDVDKAQLASGATATIGYYAPAGRYFSDDIAEGIQIDDIIDFGTTKPVPLTSMERSGDYVVVPTPKGNVQVQMLDIKERILGRLLPLGKNVDDFYRYENNSVVKSFESTMGMGLAAVVTQLQFTWMDALWGAGEDGPGYRAPRSCKVQMSFEPIHDIAPGLDHEGINRAPIYPVGSLVNNLVEGGEDEPYGRFTSKMGSST
jgi:hypothetical protein